MAEEHGVSGELVLSRDHIRAGTARVAIDFQAARVSATLDRSDRRRVFRSLRLEPGFDGDTKEIVIPLPRVRAKEGDKVCWQAYKVR